MLTEHAVHAALCVCAVVGDACGVQDLDALNTPAKVKKYLREENIDFEPGTAGYILYGRAKARMKRKQAEVLDVTARRSLFNEQSAITVKDALEVIDRVTQGAIACKKFYKIVFAFEDIAFETVKEKHMAMINDKDFCRGLVRNGKCCNPACQQDGIVGVPSYSFKSILRPPDANEPLLQVQCSAGAGSTMFGCEAGVFKAKPDAEQLTAIEMISGKPMKAGIIITHDPDTDDTLVCIYDVAAVDA